MKQLTIYFTSDVHGYFSPLDYPTGEHADTGLANCMSRFQNDGNTLIIDGGDTLQGSPFTYYLHKNGLESPCVPARIMNCAGYDFFTLGNHDFNYGQDYLRRYIRAMDARCLCANVHGLEGVHDYAVVTLQNGLRVGLTGIVTHHVNIWERPENLTGLTITEPVPAAAAALAAMKAENVDITVCIYHGGFECDLDTGAVQTDSDENQGYRICRELDFDVLLTGHQHIQCIFRLNCKSRKRTVSSGHFSIQLMHHIIFHPDRTCQQKYCQYYNKENSSFYLTHSYHLRNRRKSDLESDIHPHTLRRSKSL